jgi:hypothetical protein
MVNTASLFLFIFTTDMPTAQCIAYLSRRSCQSVLSRTKVEPVLPWKVSAPKQIFALQLTWHPVEAPSMVKVPDHVLEAHSADAASTLPVTPTPIDHFRCEDHECKGSPVNFRPGVPTPAMVADQVLDGLSAGRWYCVSQGRQPGVFSSW